MAGSDRPRVRTDARAWVEVDLDAIAGNFRAISALLPRGCELMVVLKADAYGHGMVPVARALERAGCASACVATAAEALELREGGFKGGVLVLGWTPSELVTALVAADVAQAIVDLGHARSLSSAALGAGVRLRAHLAVDTGMHRLGVPWDEADALDAALGMEGLRVEGVFSHLATADGSVRGDLDAVGVQLARFLSAVGEVRARDARVCAHLAGSYATLLHPSTRLDAVRVGIALYGVASSVSASLPAGLGLRPALSLRARVACVRHVPAGEGVGYGLLGADQGGREVATVAVGYADGVPRALSGRGAVLVRGRRCPVVGRVCMDQLMVDVTGAGPVSPGEVATLVGRDGGSRIGVEELADAAGTISNEVLLRLGPRLGRVLAGG